MECSFQPTKCLLLHAATLLPLHVDGLGDCLASLRFGDEKDEFCHFQLDGKVIKNVALLQVLIFSWFLIVLHICQVVSARFQIINNTVEIIHFVHYHEAGCFRYAWLVIPRSRGCRMTKPCWQSVRQVEPQKICRKHSLKMFEGCCSLLLLISFQPWEARAEQDAIGTQLHLGNNPLLPA